MQPPKTGANKGANAATMENQANCPIILFLSECSLIHNCEDSIVTPADNAWIERPIFNMEILGANALSTQPTIQPSNPKRSSFDFWYRSQMGPNAI